MIDVAQIARRRDFGRFLRQRRSLLQPAEVGLPAGGRRHVSGLRRTEVAEIADVGVTWYSMLEQGRVDAVSSRMLDAIATALRFSPGERDHLGELAADAFVPSNADLSPPELALLEFVRGIEFGLAFVVSPTFHVVAYNDQADEFFEFTEHGCAPNLLRIMLADVRMRARFVAPSYDDVLRQMIGHFRLSFGRYGGAAFANLIQSFLRYEAFANAWNDCALKPPPSERSRIVLRNGRARDVCVMAFTSFSAPAYTLIFKIPARLPNEAGKDHAQGVYGRATQGVDGHSKSCLEFGAFLRRRREEIGPQDVGLSSGGRRHARGLRRDEVASRAGIGVSRYTMLEQGHIGKLPARTLRAVADALLLGSRERTYLSRLVASPSVPFIAEEPSPSADLAEFVRSYRRGLAHFHDADFNMIAWNLEAGRFYGFDAYERPNLLEVMADNPALRRAFVDPTWEATLRHMLAHYRFTHASPVAKGREEMLASLVARVPDFARLFDEERSVGNPAIARARFNLPAHGVRDTNVFLLTPATCPNHVVVLKSFVEPLQG